MAAHETSDSSPLHLAHQSHEMPGISGRRTILRTQSRGSLENEDSFQGCSDLPREGSARQAQLSTAECTTGVRTEADSERNPVGHVEEADWHLIHQLRTKLRSRSFCKSSSGSATAPYRLSVRGPGASESPNVLHPRCPEKNDEEFSIRHQHHARGRLVRLLLQQAMREAAELQTESCGEGDLPCSDAEGNPSHSSTELPLVDREVKSLLKLNGDESVADLNGRIRTLEFWFSKIGGDLNVWIVRAVDAHQQLLETQHHIEHMEQRLIQQAAVLKKQHLDICNARKERDDLLEQIFRLKASASEAEALSRSEDTEETVTSGWPQVDAKMLQQQINTLKAERDDVIGRLYYEQQKNKELERALEKQHDICRSQHKPKIQEQEAALAAAAEEVQQLQRQLIQYKVKYAESAFELQFQGAFQSERGRSLQSPRLTSAAFDSLRHPALRSTKASDGLAASFRNQQTAPPLQHPQHADGSTYFSPRGPISVTAHSSPVVPPLQLQLLQNQILDEQCGNGENVFNDKNQPHAREDKRWARALGGPKKFLSKVFGGLTARDQESSPNVVEAASERVPSDGRQHDMVASRGNSRDSSGSSGELASDRSQRAGAQWALEASASRRTEDSFSS